MGLGALLGAFGRLGLLLYEVLALLPLQVGRVLFRVFLTVMGALI